MVAMDRVQHVFTTEAVIGTVACEQHRLSGS